MEIAVDGGEFILPLEPDLIQENAILSEYRSRRGGGIYIGWNVEADYYLQHDCI